MPVPKREREFHRREATRCFNRTWDYLEMKARTPEQNREMLYLAHASRYHWGLVGRPRNRAIGEWQLSRVYSALGQPRLALLFAKSCLATCKGARLSGLTPSANEVIARAYAVAGDDGNARKYIARARRQLDRLVLDNADRRVYRSQILETEALLQRRSVRERTLA